MADKRPEGWVKTTLGEIRHDASKSISQEQMRGETFELYSVPAFSEGKPEIVSGDTIGSNKVLVSPGDVLLCKINPRINRAWVVGASQSYRQIASTEWIVFSKIEGVSPEFLRYFFSQEEFRDYLVANVSGVGGSLMRVRPGIVENYPFVLPPIVEQERIVTKLNAAWSRFQRAETATRRAQHRLQKYRSAVLRAAVTGELTREWRENQQKPIAANIESGKALLQRLLVVRRSHWEETELERFRAVGRKPHDDQWKSQYDDPAPPDMTNLSAIPHGWTWVRLQQLGFISGGLTKNPRRMALRLKLPYLRVANVYANELRLDNVETIGVNESELDKLLLEKGDLLIVEGNGSKDQIGRLAIWDGSIEKCVHQNHLIKVRLVEKQIGEWILFWLLSPPGRQYIEKVASSTTGLYTLSINKVSDLPIPLPSVAEQTEIVREVENRFLSANRLAATLEQKLAQIGTMHQLLLREAFVGSLVPHKLNDEPATVLLERIHSEKIRLETAHREDRARSRKQQKIPTMKVMKKSLLTPVTLAAAFERIGRKANAELLFRESGCTADEVTTFYETLRMTPEVREAFEKEMSKTSKRHEPVALKGQPQPDKKGRFRLIELWLEDFKNLKDYTIRFDPEHEIDVVLGWNGTGKSNLIEVLVIIFRDLHEWWARNHWPKQPTSGYRLQYEIEEQLIEIVWNPHEMKRPTINRLGWLSQSKKLDQPEPIKRIDLALPHFVFGYYSGPTNRLAEYFQSMKQAHYKRLRDAPADDSKTMTTLLEQRRFFCAETHHAKYVLLAFSYKEDTKINEFLEKYLRIIHVESALFIIRKPSWAKPKDKAEDFWKAKGIMRSVMERLRRYAIAPMVLEQKVNYGYQSTTEEHYYFFLPDIESLRSFAADYQEARTFFLALESTDFSELIYDVKIQVRVKATNTEEVPITFREMSEGEQQLLMVLGLLRFTKSHQSLVLLDEPDTHLNPHWSVGYLKLLSDIMSDDRQESDEQQTSQILISTHDPLVIASLVKEQIHLLKRDWITGACKWFPASVNPRGLGFTGILTSEMFGFRSDLDEETLTDLDNKVRLMAKEEDLDPDSLKELESINKRLEEAGFLKAFSDPYYAAFVRAWGRKYNELMANQQFLTPEQMAEIDRISSEVLEEVKAELENEDVD